MMVLFFALVCIETLLQVQSETLNCPGSGVVELDFKSNFKVNELKVFHFKGLSKNPMWSLASVKVNFTCSAADYHVSVNFDNRTACDELVSSQSTFFGWIRGTETYSPKVVEIPPYRTTFIGIIPSLAHLRGSSCTLSLSYNKVNFVNLVTLVSSMLLFFKAVQLSRNVALHYSAGTLVGVFGSILVLSFLVSRFLPRKTFSVAVLLGGWSMTAYLLKLAYQNALEIVMDYWPFLLGYLAIVGGFSFCVAYYRGPWTNYRSQTLIAGALKLVALAGLYNSFQLNEVSVAAVFLLLLHRYMFQLWCHVHLWARRKRMVWFPPKKKLISQDQYREEGRLETERALEELRQFCRSRDNGGFWKIVRNVSTPNRLASFVEGESHLSAMEISQYEEEMSQMAFSDDDSLDCTSDSAEIMSN